VDLRSKGNKVASGVFNVFAGLAYLIAILCVASLAVLPVYIVFHFMLKYW
jgi:hypothetical protein